MSRNLRGRLDRLEGRSHAPRACFWSVLYGLAHPDDLEGPDREMWETLEALPGGLYGRPVRTGADEIEEKITRAAFPGPGRNSTSEPDPYHEGD